MTTVDKLYHDCIYENKQSSKQYYSAVLERKYGKKEQVSRCEFEEKAYTFYTSQIIVGARKVLIPPL